MSFEEFKDEYQKVPVEEYPNQAPENPMVSVCVQTYQHASYIRECLDSILMQETDFPFEILLGEDASTDGTREICIEYAEKHPYKIRLFLHHRENNIRILDSPTGRFNFLNNLYLAKGKYIAICDGDDYWVDNNKLKKQTTELSLHPDLNICFHPSQRLYDSIIKGISGENGDKKTIIHSNKVIENPNTVCPMQSIMFRNININRYISTITNTIGGHWNLQAFYSIPNGAIYLPDVMAVYRIGSESSILKNVVSKKENYLRHMKIKIEETKKLKKAFGSQYTHALDQRRKTLYYNIFTSTIASLSKKLRILTKSKTQLNPTASLYYILIGEARKIKHKLKSFLWTKR